GLLRLLLRLLLLRVARAATGGDDRAAAGRRGGGARPDARRGGHGRVELRGGRRVGGLGELLPEGILLREVVEAPAVAPDAWRVRDDRVLGLRGCGCNAR